MTRIGSESAAGALVYQVQVYIAGGQSFEGRLELSSSGEVQLDGLPAEHWCHGEALKLARVLKKKTLSSFLRWREGPKA